MLADRVHVDTPREILKDADIVCPALDEYEEDFEMGIYGDADEVILALAKLAAELKIMLYEASYDIVNGTRHDWSVEKYGSAQTAQTAWLEYLQEEVRQSS